MVTVSDGPAILEFGRFRVVPHRRQLLADGKPVRLGGRTFDLLMTLIEASGGVVSKDHLLSRVWPDRIVEENRLQGEISALRKAFGADRGLIQTVSGRGYQFTGEIRELGARVRAPQVPAPFAIPTLPRPEPNLPEGEAERIDREATLVDVTDHVVTHRLVTPIGDGGVGEERPGFQSGQQLPSEIADEVTKHNDAERRQITAMSCEAIGAAAQSDGIGLEDLLEAIGAFQHCVSEVVGRHSGFIASRIGNTVLVLFGYPAAHEHDAERTVHAGLELCAAVRALRPDADVPMRCRVGIATGMVIVGDLAGAGEVREHGIVGEAPDLAARLRLSTQPDTVTIEPTTWRQIGNLFDCRDLDALDTNSETEPIRRWQVLGKSAVASRFEALRGSQLTRLVGREEEIDLMLRRWARAKAGDGHVVLLSGEAGIGKSRLTAALLECVAAEPHTRLRYFCSPHRADSALHPIIGQMERAAGLAYDDKPQAQLDKLDALLARTSTSFDDAALLAEMLSLPNDGRYPALALTPEQRRQRTLEALMSQLQALARQQPVLEILEDAHWVDPTSLEAFGRTIDRVKTLPVLLIITFRPEFNAPWVGQSHVTSLTLNRLGEREAVAIIAQLVGNRELPADVIAEIVERTDGIPLFVEEMTKAVLEAERDSVARRTVAAVPSSALTVPASLHASLMARLDRLGPAKAVAQIASAIGREFSHALLASVARKPEAELGSALDRLVQAGLLFRHGVPPHASYLFKHALVQDGAYSTLLREPRRALHARVAETLESQFAETAESRPDILAHHCTEAGLIEKAASLWGKAGQQSLMRSALAEAAAQFSRALNHISTLPGTPRRRREQIELQAALITPLIHTKGHAAAETKAVMERARLLIEHAEALGERPEDPLLLFSVLYGFWATNYVAFNGDAMRDLAAQFLALAEKQRATAPLMIGHRLVGTSLVLTGDIAQGRWYLDQAVARYDAAEHRPLATRFGQDVGVANLSYRSLALWLLGYPEAALRDNEDALKNARKIDQAATLLYALYCATVSRTLCGNLTAASAQAQELVALSEEKGFSFWQADAMINQGIVLAAAGRAPNAIKILIAGMTARRTTAATFWMPLYLPYLARAHAELGQFEEAWRRIGEATTAVETTKETWCEAEIHRTAGEITLLSPEPDAAKAQAHFARALAVARKQQAKSWELRAATSMARLWRGQGKCQQARELLAPIYGCFTEGFDTLDLKHAKALLDELAL